MADDPTVRWHLATPLGIEIDAASEAWHSGHVDDLIPFTDQGAILVATESGGVWLVDASNTALPLSSTWDVPDVKCLAAGPDGPRHIFAGCTIAYDSNEKRSYKNETGSAPVIMESGAAELAPLLSWTPIASALPATAGRITRIVVIPKIRRIVVSCAQLRGGDTGGIFWATIPVTRFAAGDPPRPPFAWRRAKVSGAPGAQGFWDIAVASTRNSPSRDNLEDKRTITLVAGGFAGGGIVVGQWDSSDELVFKRATVQFDDGTDASALLFDGCGSVSVSSCELRPTTVFAACAWPDGRLNAVLKSKDGGRQWTFCAATKAGGGEFDKIAVDAGDQGKNWNNCISAHPMNPGIAALGWVLGPYLTFDGGTTWKLVEFANHTHHDLHALRFAVEVPETIGSLFVGSDGGVIKIDLDDLPGVNGPPVRSDFNKNLATLQCYSMLYRQFTGTIDISSSPSGVLVAGLQDNGNAVSKWRPTVEPWRKVDGGDGGWNALVLGGYLHTVLDTATKSNAPLTAQVQTATIPISMPAPGDPNGLKVFIGDPVMQPSHRNANGQLLVGMASAIASTAVFGLYANDGVVPPYQWQQIGAVPTGQTVAALASFDGDRVFIGTAQGKIYALDTGTGSVAEQKIKLPKPSPSTRMAGGAVMKIVGFDADSMFASLLGASEIIADGSGVPANPAVQGYVLRLEAGSWIPTAGVGLPGELLYGFVAVAAPDTEVPRGLLAAVDDGVYISRDDGANWRRASLGLPRRPHCGDLRFANDALAGPTIALGTFGRSVWIANLA